MKYATYSEYKPSTTDWLPPVPTHWNSNRLRHLLSERLQYGANESAELDAPELPRYVRITDIDENDSLREETFRSLPEETAKPYLLKDGDVLFARSGATSGKTFLYRSTWGRCAYAGYLIRARVDQQKLLPSFLRYFTASSNYWQWLSSSYIQATIQNVSAEKYADLWLPLPPLTEQQTIARFLDAKTAQIDALVAQKRQLIEKLKEKRQALIARTVTRGLPPEAAKAAGLEMDSDSKCSKEIHPLIGSLPMGWRSLKLRRVATVQGGYAFKSDDFQQEGIPVVRMNSLKRGVLELEGAACIDESECIEAVALRIGDVLYGMSGSVGETGSLGNFAVVRDSDVPCQLNQRVGRFLVRKKELLLGFLVYLIQAPYFYDQILLQATGTAQFNVSGGQIESVLIALPPLEAQRLMVDFLDARCAEIDALQRKTEQALESLYEFRTAIVTSAVTGKIDVRGAT